MKTFGNILWYIFPIPLLGLMWVISAFLGGALWCMTVLGIPLGLGLFQVSKFALAPFNRALITRKEYEMLTGEKQNTVMKGWSLVIRILYIPFGLIASFLLIVVAIGSFLTIIGIPNGLIYIKLIPAVFNPIGKICVPRVVGEEVERMKETNQLNKYSMKPDTGATSQPVSTASTPVSTAAAVSIAPAAPAVSYDLLLKAQAKSDEELETMLNNSDEYNPAMVAAAREVLARRKPYTPEAEAPQPESPLLQTPQPESQQLQTPQPETPAAPAESADAPVSEAVQAASLNAPDAQEWMQKLKKPPYLYGVIGAGAVLLAGIITCICLCFGGKDYESADLRAYGLHGRVKIATTIDYEYTEQSGKIVRGAATDETTRMEFDKNGYISLYRGSIIRYNDDGTMESSNYLNSLNRNADGQLKDAECIVDLDGEIEIYQWEYDELGFLSREVYGTPHWTIEHTYHNDKNGNLIYETEIIDFDGNRSEKNVDYRYLKFDEKGNWTERLDRYSYDDAPEVRHLEVRTLTYYEGNEKDEGAPVTVKKEYEGTIGGARIRMSLIIDDFNISGTYVYTKYNAPISLTGKKHGCGYRLYERTGDKETGAFDLCINTDSSLYGLWVGQGNQFQVNLHEIK